MSEASPGTAPAIEIEAVIDERATEQPQVQPDAAPAIADPAVADAERIAFLALGSELARERSVLVIDDGAGALSGVAARLESVGAGSLGEVDVAACDLVVAELATADDSSAAVIAELARVVDIENGIALVRMPNRPEFAPLLAQLEAAFTRTIVLRQHNWVSSALFDDKMFENDDPSRAVAASVRKLAAAMPDQALYNVVVATHGEFPRFRPQLALTRSPELKQALERLAQAEHAQRLERDDFSARSAAQAARIRELEEEIAWYDENQLALRETVEQSALAATLLAIWVAVRSNMYRIRRVLRG